MKRRTWFKLLVLVLVLMLLNLLGQWLLERFEDQLRVWLVEWGWVVLLALALLYALLLSLPFVPGVELGWVLMMLFGAPGVVIVYLATLAGLLLSFAVGRCLPLNVLARLLDWLHLHRAARFVLNLEPLSPDQRLNLLIERAPHRILPFLCRHRYLALAVAFNVPGNSLIGGGGGIGLLAGMSRLFRPPGYAVMTALAVSPVPLTLLVYNLWILGPAL